MSTPYGVSTSWGSWSYGGYVQAPITGPLSTNQTPCQIPYHSYGLLPGVRPTPPQFYPSQEPVNANMNTNARWHYLRTAVSKQAREAQLAAGKASKPNEHFIASSQRQVPVSTHVNYIPPLPSSLRTNNLKAVAVGQTAYKIGLPVEALTGTKSYYPSGTRTAIRRVRSGGCTAPKKKGAVENYSLKNPAICGWGSVVRQNY